MKVNWFSPLPPSQTGIAEYSQHVLAALSQRARVTMWTDQEEWDPQLEAFGRVRRYDDPPDLAEMNQADTTFYNIGNNSTFHAGIWQVSRRHAGTVILHDTRLQHLYTCLYLGEWNQPEAYRAAMTRHHGQAGLEAAESHLNGEMTTEQLSEQFPLTTLALENALGAVVHVPSDVASLALATRPVTYLPLPYAAGSAPEINAVPPTRRDPGGPPYRILVFGYLGPNRRLDVILRALKSFERCDDFHLHVYGKLVRPDLWQQLIRQEGLAQRVTLHGYVTDAELDDALASAHLAINLRFPTMGEASWTQLRLWSHALPSLVTRTGWYATLPEQAVAFVRPAHEVADIQQHLTRFLDNPAAFAQQGEAGLRVLREQHAPETYASRLLDAARQAERLRRCERGCRLVERTGGIFRKPLLPTDTLFFLHLPKCGGTTFNALLHQMFRRDVELYDNPYRRRELLDTPPEVLRAYRLIRGHFQYPDVINKLGFQPRTVTFLRDPITRFISHFQMLRHPVVKPRNAAQRAHHARFDGISFEQFLDRPELTTELADLQYRFLAGYRIDKSGRHVCDFDQPYERLLDQFDVVGLLERFDESLQVFSFVFDLPAITTYAKRNAGANRIKRSELSREVLERVAELNQHDLQLYALAHERFEQQRQQMRIELDRHSDGLPMLEEPQESISLDMSRVPPGNNWWGSFEHPRFGCVRWTGPGRSANLDLPLTPGSKHVELTVIAAAGDDVLRSLKLVVEGKEVPLTWKRKFRRFPRVYTGTIPGEAVRVQRRTKLSLEVSETRHSESAPQRDCGICVSSLEIIPANATSAFPAFCRQSKFSPRPRCKSSSGSSRRATA